MIRKARLSRYCFHPVVLCMFNIMYICCVKQQMLDCSLYTISSVIVNNILYIVIYLGHKVYYVMKNHINMY